MAVNRADTGFQRRGFEIRSAQGILLDGGPVASISEKLTLKSLEIRFPVFCGQVSMLQCLTFSRETQTIPQAP